MNEFTMTQELKDKWLTALRSGKYKQSRHALRDDHGFCCLGVLCDVVNSNGWRGKTNDPDSYGTAQYFSPYPHSQDNWLEVLGEHETTLANLNKKPKTLPPKNGKYPDDFCSSTLSGQLTEMNDYGYSFASIANYLDVNLEVTEKGED